MISFTVRMTFRPEDREDIATILRELTAASRQEPGCISYIAHRVESDPDTIVILPDLDDNCYELVEVGTQIPSGIGTMVGGDVNALLGQLTTAYGKFGYAAFQSFDPVALKAIVGDYFYPAFKSNLLQWIVKVH